MADQVSENRRARARARARLKTTEEKKTIPVFVARRDLFDVSESLWDAVGVSIHPTQQVCPVSGHFSCSRGCSQSDCYRPTTTGEKSWTQHDSRLQAIHQRPRNIAVTFIAYRNELFLVSLIASRFFVCFYVEYVCLSVWRPASVYQHWLPVASLLADRSRPLKTRSLASIGFTQTTTVTSYLLVE